MDPLLHQLLKVPCQCHCSPPPIAPSASVAACSPPTILSPFDVALLTLLGAAGQQNHQRVAVASKIDPVAWPPIDPVFEHPLAYAFCVREIALPEPDEGDRHLCRRRRIEASEPFFEGALSVARKVITQLKHPLSNT